MWKIITAVIGVFVLAAGVAWMPMSGGASGGIEWAGGRNASLICNDDRLPEVLIVPYKAGMNSQNATPCTAPDRQIKRTYVSCDKKPRSIQMRNYEPATEALFDKQGYIEEMEMIDWKWFKTGGKCTRFEPVYKKVEIYVCDDPDRTYRAFTSEDMPGFFDKPCKDIFTGKILNP